MNITAMYESLKGSRMINEELTIPGFTAEDYEALWEYMVKEVVAPALKGEDFYHWIGRKAYSYYRFRKHKKNRGRYNNLNEMPEFYDTLTSTAPEALSTRQMLVIFKFHTYRRSHFESAFLQRT